MVLFLVPEDGREVRQLVGEGNVVVVVEAAVERVSGGGGCEVPNEGIPGESWVISGIWRRRRGGGGGLREAVGGEADGVNNETHAGTHCKRRIVNSTMRMYEGRHLHLCAR